MTLTWWHEADWVGGTNGVEPSMKADDATRFPYDADMV
ncbi:hypothetical protein DYY67_0812 [Candidatus Nitrosotalea sp. TS]|nr:hypothetical protein [Candidatus Nitrosotalea sp. TS]